MTEGADLFLHLKRITKYVESRAGQDALCLCKWKGAEISSHRGGGGAGCVSEIFSVAKATPEILVHGH